jgi:hypothetical protein
MAQHAKFAQLGLKQSIDIITSIFKSLLNTYSLFYYTPSSIEDQIALTLLRR